MLSVFNTLTRKKENFLPLHDKKVGLYTCGPTVYHYAHIGNLRTFIFEDILKRVLLENSYRVKHIMNITDVGHLTDDADAGEDKMEKGARREGKTAWEIADFYTDAFLKDIDALHILPPDKLPKATDHIKEQIKLVKALAKKGFAYETSDGIYFDTTKLADYGKLALLDKQSLKAGARVEMGEKKNPHDFALWKFTPAGQTRQMEWKAFGRMGFPGWHLECSAMSMKYLGAPFDIHCGGVDHIPVHHTNEIAQSEAATGKKPWVNYWLHGEFLILGEEKMAKSGENFITLATLKEKDVSPIAYRYFVLQTHYRKPLTFSWEALHAAQTGLDHLYDAVRGLGDKKSRIGCAEFEKEFMDAANDDLNTPQALAVLWKLLKSDYPAYAKKATLLRFEKILGLRLDAVPAYAEAAVPADVKELLKKREAARKNKDWKESDILREKIAARGFTIEDTPESQRAQKKIGLVSPSDEACIQESNP